MRILDQNFREYRFLWLAGLLFFVFSSCKKDKQGAEITNTPELKSSVQNIVLHREDAEKEAITFSWSLATVQGTQGALTYFLQWDRKGNNFANAAQAILGKDISHFAYSHMSFNYLMSTLPVEVASPIELRIVTATSDGAVMPFYSNVITLTVTPYAKELPPPYSQLWLVGDATPAGWNIDSPSPMLQNSNDPYLFSYSGALNAGEFKIPTAKGSWDAPFYRPVTGSPDLSDTRVQLSAGEPDYKWKITTAGTYKVNLDLRALKITIAKQ
nr:SusF/SusE family outer membrane protein [Pedobacter sp. ASV19]